MKKNYMMRIASVLLVVVLLTTSIISGTLAKYTSLASGTANARVAKWSIKIEDADIAAANTESFTFNLFDTIVDSVTVNNGTISTSSESDVATAASGENYKIIAPGTGGYFQIDIENASEVTAKYSIDWTLTNSMNIPVMFSLDNQTWYKSIDQLNTNTNTNTTINFGTSGNTALVTIYWKWAFENNEYYTDTSSSMATTADDYDSYLGQLAAAATTDINGSWATSNEGAMPILCVTANVTVTQVD